MNGSVRAVRFIAGGAFAQRYVFSVESVLADHTCEIPPPRGDVRVSGRTHTPSWVYRRRLTGRLWNTTTLCPWLLRLRTVGLRLCAPQTQRAERAAWSVSGCLGAALVLAAPASAMRLAVQRAALSCLRPRHALPTAMKKLRIVILRFGTS